MIGSITQIWTSLMEWITENLTAVQTVFYADGALTFLGTLSVIVVGIGVVLLLVGIVQNFLHLRG